MFVGTWNVGGEKLKEDLSLYDWLLPKNDMKDTPDMYIIGLQEIVELNPNFVMISSNTQWVQNWKNIITNNLDAIDK